MGGVAIILLLVVAIVIAVIGVVGWVSGWWLTTETDAHGEPGSGRDSRNLHPAHNIVEDEANQKIVGEPGDPK
jgi:hypothetical protein